MKKYFNALIMLSLINLGIVAVAMHKNESEKTDNEPNSLELERSAILPNELWAIILEFAYFDSNVINKSFDIHEALANVRATLPLISKSLRLACKNFKSINEGLYLSKDELKSFYQNILKNRFLESRDSGLYPISDRWILDEKTNSKIAQFISAIQIANDASILIDLIKINSCTNDEQIIRNKLVDLVLFYNANVNVKDKNGSTVLRRAIYCHRDNNNLRDVIVMLLTHGANVNIEDQYSSVALHAAIHCHSNDNNLKDIIVMLLTHGVNVNSQDIYGTTALTRLIYRHSNDDNLKDMIVILLAHRADVNIQDNEGDTSLMIAQKKNFEGFDKLVKVYSPQGTLKNLCLRFILTYHELFKDKLAILPQELRELFQF